MIYLIKLNVELFIVRFFVLLVFFLVKWLKIDYNSIFIVISNYYDIIYIFIFVIYIMFWYGVYIMFFILIIKK